MNCINCKSEWTTPLGITVTECPFCKKSIEPTKIPKTYLTAKDALCFIMQTYGAEALLTKSLFSDIAPNLSDERELIKIFREKGTLDILNSALKSSTAEQSIAIKRAIGKLPLYLQVSTVAISLMNDFATALGWNVPPPSIAKSIPPQMMNILPLKQPNLATNPQKTNTLEFAPKIGCVIQFGKYDWHVLDVEQGQTMLQSNEVIENKRYYMYLNSIIWEESELREYLISHFIFLLDRISRTSQNM